MSDGLYYLVLGYMGTVAYMLGYAAGRRHTK